MTPFMILMFSHDVTFPLFFLIHHSHTTSLFIVVPAVVMRVVNLSLISVVFGCYTQPEKQYSPGSLITTNSHWVENQVAKLGQVSQPHWGLTPHLPAGQ